MRMSGNYKHFLLQFKIDFFSFFPQAAQFNHFSDQWEIKRGKTFFLKIKKGHRNASMTLSYVG